MEMKWHPTVNGDLSGIPRDEELLFTVFDEEDSEIYVGSKTDSKCICEMGDCRA